ncbi:MAG TPA: hypothetical protein VNU97_06010 [Rhizomicrobium sp.]|jgi:hypothetical protein|nr:hypothetical protein [Rhizomicrobium sp.]
MSTPSLIAVGIRFSLPFKALPLPESQHGWAIAFGGVVLIAWAAWGMYLGFVGGGFVLNRFGPITRRQGAPFWTMATIFSAVFAVGVMIVLFGLVAVYRWETR